MHHGLRMCVAIITALKVTDFNLRALQAAY